MIASTESRLRRPWMTEPASTPSTAPTPARAARIATTVTVRGRRGDGAGRGTERCIGNLAGRLTTCRTLGSPYSSDEMVGARGFEPPTSASRTLRAAKLRHAPTEGTAAREAPGRQV